MPSSSSMPSPRAACLRMLLIAACLAPGMPPLHAASPPRAAPPLTWPRNFDAASQHIEIYQPQVEQWDGDLLSGRAAVAVGARDGTPTYGVVRFSARADIDKASGLVQMRAIRIDSVDVPTNPGAADQVRQALVARLPPAGLTVPLDELQASYAASQEIARANGVAVKNDAPRIVFASAPTLLVLIDGEPAWREAGGTRYQHALNTRALLLRDSAGQLYLQAAGYWYGAAALAGPWQVMASPPQALLAAAGKAQAGARADPMLPADGKRPAAPPAILVATAPTELIVTDGAPALTPVAGVSLLTVSNTDRAVFVDPASNRYYVLVSGRWFAAPGMDGPWRFVPGSELPADFARISPQDPKANVLVSVPGTPQAREASIAATIPQTASVSRAKASLTVAFDGSPRFAPIEGTTLNYAVNSATPVIQTDGEHFYAVANGVWFTAAGPTGPWRVATEVPGAIYTIPASSPLHYVTYVRIYSVAPDTVVVGYTPGYMGVVIGADGTVVYGTGYAYPAYVGNVYYGYPPTYGYGAGFALGAAEGFAFGFAAGAFWGAASPYWGPYWWGGGYNWNYVNVNRANFYGRWGQGTVTHASGWNAWTGTQWRGTAGAGYNPATGARFQGSAGAAFNPYSGNAAAGRQGAFHDPSTGSAGAGRGGIAGNEYTGNYAGGRQVAGYNAQTGRAGAAEFGVAGNTQTGQREAGSKGFVVNRGQGNGVAWNNGDVYAGHDGNIYQHTQDGGWQKHTGGGWEPVQPGANVGGQLEQQRQARDVGQQRFGQTAHQWGGGDFGGRGGGRRLGGGFRGFHR
ncbi:carbohydrate-binding family V/XII [Cupriavidus sp. 30B13]|uniref:carbohydrate-binding family V/XII n=1 Tax=Cupriavidus sp. 30B13 TaxID=3384241 RepID=UPI003B8ED68F